VTGTVAWLNGTPAADLTVYFYATSCDNDDEYPDTSHSGQAATGETGAFEFPAFGGQCYEVGIEDDGDNLGFTVDGGSDVVTNHTVVGGAAGIAFRLATAAPVPVAVTVPGYKPGAEGNDYITVYRLVDDSWEWHRGGSMDQAGAVTFQLAPGGTYTVNYVGESDASYYSQWAGGAAVLDHDLPPADVQRFTVPAQAPEAAWTLTLREGSKVTGKIALDGELARDVIVSLVTLYAYHDEESGPVTAVTSVTETNAADDGSFVLAGLVPGRSYTLRATSRFHAETWLGGLVISEDSPSWDSVRGPAFTAAAGGGSVAGKNIALTVRQAFIEDSLPLGADYSRAINAVTGESYFASWENGGEDLLFRVPAGVYLMVAQTEDSDESPSNPVTAHALATASAGVTTKVAYPAPRALDFSATLGSASISVAGTAVVGGTLTAAASAPNASAGVSPQFAYYWTDGATVLGSGRSYKPKAADKGKALHAFAVASGTGVAATLATRATAVIAGAPLANPPAVSVTVSTRASNKVGQSLAVRGLPAGWAAACQWLRNGKPIAGATGASYKLSAADAGSSVTVQVRATRAGYADLHATGQPVAVPKIAPKVTVKQLKGGKVRVTVKAKGLPKPTGKVTVEFGKAKSVTYKLKAGAKGKLTKKIPAAVGAGKHKVTATYKGNAQIARATSKRAVITVR
jgi:hypothetical protein